LVYLFLFVIWIHMMGLAFSNLPSHHKALISSPTPMYSPFYCGSLFLSYMIKKPCFFHILTYFYDNKLSVSDILCHSKH
jgi:hypothetical protein